MKPKKSDLLRKIGANAGLSEEEIRVLLDGVKWSNNTAFPVNNTLSGSELFPGLQSGANFKTTLNSGILPFIQTNIQIAESQVTDLITDLAAKLDLAGGTMTGNLFLNADPTSDLQAATKHYVDSVISANDTLQDVYNNGTPGQQGSILLTSDNLNPFATFNSYSDGNQEHFIAVNLDGSTLWGYGFRSVNSISSFVDFAHIYAGVEDNTAGNETGSLGLYVNSFGTLTQAFLMDGSAQETTSTWPMVVQNGTRTYQTTQLLTGDITYSGINLGAVLLSDDVALHSITINNSFSTNGDDSFVVQTQSTYGVELIPDGTTINESSSSLTIPPSTRATVQLVNDFTKDFMVTYISVPEAPEAFSAYLSGTVTGVTGDGTSYQIPFDTQIGDVNPNFNTSTGVFTADRTGYWNFATTVRILGINSSNLTDVVRLVTTSYTYPLFNNNPFATMDEANTLSFGGSNTVWMTAGDTAYVQIEVDDNGSPNIDVAGAVLPYVQTTFSGFFVGTSGGTDSGDGQVNVTNDDSTDARMFLLWVTSNSGTQPVFVSSDECAWNPANTELKIGPDINDNIDIQSNPSAPGGTQTITYNSAFPYGFVGTQYNQGGQLWQVGIQPDGFSVFSIYDFDNNMYVLQTDPNGSLGPTFGWYVDYPAVSFRNALSANNLVGTDDSNYLTSIPNTLGQVNVTDDNSTNAAMYPVWVTGNSSNQLTFVSSTNFQWNPGLSQLTLSSSDSQFFIDASTGGSIFLSATTDLGSAYSLIRGTFDAEYQAERGDSSQYALVKYLETGYPSSGNGVWSHGIRANDYNWHLTDESNNVHLIICIPGRDTIIFPGLTPGTLVATDPVTNELISVPNPPLGAASYAVLGYSLNTNDTTFGSPSTYVPIVLNTASTTGNTSDFSINSSTGEITYNGAVPATLRVSCQTSGIAGIGGQNIFVAPATDIGSGYVVYTYLAQPDIYDILSPSSVTTSAIVPVVVSGAKFQMWAQNTSGVSFFRAQTMYFSVEVL